MRTNSHFPVAKANWSGNACQGRTLPVTYRVEPFVGQFSGYPHALVQESRARDVR